MTFQELLLKTRGLEWKPPVRLMAIDPGETIGHASFIDGEFMFATQIKNLNEFIETLDSFEPNVVAYEDYKIYSNRLDQHTLSGIPTLKIIGAIELVCDMKGYQKIPMLASTAKGFVTNEKLKEWQFYQKGRKHANDALRVGLHSLLFSKEI